MKIENNTNKIRKAGNNNVNIDDNKKLCYLSTQ